MEKGKHYRVIRGCERRRSEQESLGRIRKNCMLRPISQGAETEPKSNMLTYYEALKKETTGRGQTYKRDVTVPGEQVSPSG